MARYGYDKNDTVFLSTRYILIIRETNRVARCGYDKTRVTIENKLIDGGASNDKKFLRESVTGSQTLNGNVNIYNFVKNSRLTKEDIKIQMETTRSKYYRSKPDKI